MQEISARLTVWSSLPQNIGVEFLTGKNFHRSTANLQAEYAIGG